MKTRVLSAIGASILMSYVGPSNADVLQSDAKPITVTYTSGEIEHYIVKWVGTRDVDHHEDGHPAIPFNGWFTDTRQCHWSITSRITRSVFLLNHNGQEYAQPELATPLVKNFANKGSDLIVTQLRPENCGDADARYKSDLADSVQAMVSAFAPNVASDYQTVISTMKGWPKVKDVQPK